MTATSSINPSAQSGFHDSSAYERFRPSYSPTLVQTLLEQLRVAGKHGARILDLGAGTGKLTEQLAAREEGFEVVAVEPHAEMRRVLEGKGLRGVRVLEARVGGPEGIEGVDEESMDAVVVAQAFHWFANMDSLRAIHRVLQPHGLLGLVWNVDEWNAPAEHQPTTAWEAGLKDMIRSIDDDQPRFRHSQWQKVFDQQLKTSPLALLKPGDQLFSLPLGEHKEKYEKNMSKQGVWDVFNTYSHIANLERDEKESAYRKVMDLIDGDDQATNKNGDAVLHGYGVAYWTSKIPSDGRASLTSVERPEA